MGYYYSIYGSINFHDKKAFQIMKYLHKEKQEPFFDEEIEGFCFDEDNVIGIDISIKNNNNYIEKLCLFIHELDNRAEGDIDCAGEESDDKFNVSFDKKGVKLCIAEVTWKKQKGYIIDKDTIRNAKILLKDKELNKKLIVSTLEDETQNKK